MGPPKKNGSHWLVGRVAQTGKPANNVACRVNESTTRFLLISCRVRIALSRHHELTSHRRKHWVEAGTFPSEMRRREPRNLYPKTTKHKFRDIINKFQHFCTRFAARTHEMERQLMTKMGVSQSGTSLIFFFRRALNQWEVRQTHTMPQKKEIQ